MYDAGMDGWTGQGLALLIGYALGSIPFGLILTRAFGAGDIRQIGSGNIGATNVLRTGRKGLAAGTLLLDALKGVVPVLIARVISPELAIYGAVGAFLGHLYPVWLGFKGGKGLATLLGAAFALDWRLGAVYAVVWLGAFAVTRISSVGGLLTALSLPIAAFVLKLSYWPALAGIAVLVFWKHRENIGRLIQGTEPKVGQKTA